LKLEIARKLLLLTALILTFRNGIMAMTYGLAVSSVIAYALNATGSRRDLLYTWMEQARDILPFVSCSVLAGGAAWIVGELWHASALPMLILKSGTGLLSYAGLLVVGRHTMFADDLEVVQKGMRQIYQVAGGPKVKKLLRR